VGGYLREGEPRDALAPRDSLFNREQMGSLRRALATVFAARRGAVAILSVATAVVSLPATASGDNIFVANAGASTVGEYTTSGTTVNASLISGLDGPGAIAVSGSNLLVASFSLTVPNWVVGEYSTSGATLDATLVSGLPYPTQIGAIAVSGSTLFVSNVYDPANDWEVGEYTITGAMVNASLLTTGTNRVLGMAVSGSNLLVANFDRDTIGEYTSSGATVNASLITGLSGPVGIAVSGSIMFVLNEGIFFSGNPGCIGSIGEYTTSGATVNASLVTGLCSPVGIAVSGSNLFVTSSTSTQSNGTIGEYTTSGAVVNASLVTGLSRPWGIAVAPVPEPSTALLLSAGIVGLTARRHRARGVSPG